MLNRALRADGCHWLYTDRLDEKGVEEDSAQDKGGLGSYVRGDQNENGRPLMTTSAQVIRYGKVVKYLEDYDATRGRRGIYRSRPLKQ